MAYQTAVNVQVGYTASTAGPLTPVTPNSLALAVCSSVSNGMGGWSSSPSGIPNTYYKQPAPLTAISFTSDTSEYAIGTILALFQTTGVVVENQYLAVSAVTGAYSFLANVKAGSKIFVAYRADISYEQYTPPSITVSDSQGGIYDKVTCGTITDIYATTFTDLVTLYVSRSATVAGPLTVNLVVSGLHAGASPDMNAFEFTNIASIAGYSFGGMMP